MEGNNNVPYMAS